MAEGFCRRRGRAAQRGGNALPELCRAGADALQHLFEFITINVALMMGATPWMRNGT